LPLTSIGDVVTRHGRGAEAERAVTLSLGRAVIMNGRVFEDGLWTVDAAENSGIPGYLVLRARAVGSSLGSLPPGDAARLGVLLAKVAGAVERETGADRVYCLSFCEVLRDLHLHLFPRTPWLAEAFARATDTTGQPIDGPALFAWARARYAAGASLPGGVAGADEVAARIRAALGP
jgi:diadenosine tetraphosphate (Ap4A) HIT family hydrolase